MRAAIAPLLLGLLIAACGNRTHYDDPDAECESCSIDSDAGADAGHPIPDAGVQDAGYLEVTLRYNYAKPPTIGGCSSDTIELCQQTRTIPVSRFHELAGAEYSNCAVTSESVTATIDCTGKCYSSTLQCSGGGTYERKQCEEIPRTGFGPTCDWYP